ncbi:hypothetical protein [Cellulosimicrobium phage DS1]|nr:hypothetical protein [Cellulosimicrobium phage DS1]
MEKATNGDPLDHILGGNPEAIEEPEGVDMMANPAAFRALDRGDVLVTNMENPFEDSFVNAMEEQAKSERAFIMEAIANTGVPDNVDVLDHANRLLTWLRTGADPARTHDVAPGGPQAPSPDGDPGEGFEAVTEAQAGSGLGVDLGPGSR